MLNIIIFVDVEENFQTMKNNMLYVWISIIAIIGILTACQSDTDNQVEPKKEVNEKETETPATPEKTGKVPEVMMTMKNGDEVIIELYPDNATNTVNNFIALIEDGFYDGLIFHRVIPGFMIQGGDPEGNGMGGPEYAIHGEFTNNGYENELVHERGVLSMARSQSPDSAGSQFFIMVEEAPHLDGDYAAFGKVIDGMDVVDEIVAVDTENEKPVKDQVIQTMTVDLKGYEAKEPMKIE